MAWQKVRIELPDDLNATDRDILSEEAIAYMVERTRRGGGVNASGTKRKKFPAYTKEYKKIKGQSNVDLSFSSKMLDALDVLSHKKGSMLIGFENGSKENDKAEGNITGSYGRSANPSKARNFLGLTKSEIKALVRDYKERNE